MHVKAITNTSQVEKNRLFGQAQEGRHKEGLAQSYCFFLSEMNGTRSEVNENLSFHLLIVPVCVLIGSVKSEDAYVFKQNQRSAR